MKIPRVQPLDNFDLEIRHEAKDPWDVRGAVRVALAPDKKHVRIGTTMLGHEVSILVCIATARRFAADLMDLVDNHAS